MTERQLLPPVKLYEQTGLEQIRDGTGATRKDLLAMGEETAEPEEQKNETRD